METSTHQPPVNRAVGNPKFDAPLPLIPEAPGGLEPVLVAHAVQPPVTSNWGFFGSTCTNFRTNVMLGLVPVDEFEDSSLREVEMMSNGSLFSPRTPHANDLPGSSMCNSPRHGLEKLEST